MKMFKAVQIVLKMNLNVNFSLVFFTRFFAFSLNSISKDALYTCCKPTACCSNTLDDSRGTIQERLSCVAAYCYSTSCRFQSHVVDGLPTSRDQTFQG